jgi:D-alanyl-D-alanine carboxypeptidase/D-alanyl-D-alanine-endopeptidase (penicillin-binding protein 4)
MKSFRLWLTPLAVLAIASPTLSYPVAASEVNTTTRSDFSSRPESIEIFVPPPENNATPATACSANVKAAIDSIISRRPNNWGILVESLTDKTVIYSHNADKYFIPASNTKIFTTAATLQRMSPDATIGSKSVRDWVTVTNHRSVNQYAEMLMRQIGGTQAAKSALTNLGIDPKSYRLADGSGLSRQNTATPRALVETLRAMYYAPGNTVFQASLPVAGVSGTLRNRMRQTPVQGIVYAKTGTLTGVRALSGYMNHPQYGLLVFSILANDSQQPGTTLVKTVDRIVLQVNSASQSCSI